jgi:hypothetical protein
VCATAEAIRRQSQQPVDTCRSSMEPVGFPHYQVLSGPRKGDVRKFEYVSEVEFLRLGRSKSVELEHNRFRSAIQSIDPAEKAKWTERRRWRRSNEPGLRQREVEQERSRRASVRTAASLRELLP